MSAFPLRYARRNILIGPGGEAAALYRADTTAYPFLPTSEKWALLFRLERFAHLAGADFSLWRVQRAYPAERYPHELADLLDAEHGDPERWRRYLDGHEARLRQLGSHVPEVYVAVSLAEAEGGPSALRSFGRARRRVEELAGVGGPRPISGAELEALAAAEQRTFDRLSGAIALQRASTRELQWLLRRAACRGVAEPELEDHWQPDALVVVSPNGPSAYEPLEHDLWRCANAPASEDPGEPPALVVEAEEATSHQAFLCAGSLAEEAEFPGAAELLFAPAEDAGFPVDAVLHAEWVGNREALGQVRRAHPRRRARLPRAARRRQRAGPARRGGPRTRPRVRGDPAVLGAPADAAGLDLAGDRRRRARGAGAAGDDAARALRRRRPAPPARPPARALRRPPPAARRRLGRRLRPADDGRAVRGDRPAGEHPGRLARRHLPRLRALGRRAAGSLRPDRGAADGAPARRAARRHARQRQDGRRRGDRLRRRSAAARWSSPSTPSPTTTWRASPSWRARSRCWSSPGDPSNQGKLDPLRIGLPELREELASSYLIELLRDPPSSWEVAIDRAVRDAVRAGEQSLLCVIARLRDGDSAAAREAGEALEVLSDFGLARLGFAPIGEAA